MTAIQTLLAGLIDYAGMYPPADLDIPSAVHNYLSYRQGPYAFALGRFIVDIVRTDELRQVAGEHLRSMPLSLIAPPEIEQQSLTALTNAGFRIESIEIKCSEPATIAELGRRLPRNIERYIEMPIVESAELLDALGASGMHAKLRMGGVFPEAFPNARSVALFLRELFRRNIAFKATAGLHHPLRACHRVTYALDSSLALMHGFINLACAAMLLHSGWSVDDAVATLEDENPDSWDISTDVITCRSFAWNIAPLRDLRSFFLSFGSCSFTEPIADLEALGWL